MFERVCLWCAAMGVPGSSAVVWCGVVWWEDGARQVLRFHKAVSLHGHAARLTGRLGDIKHRLVLSAGDADVDIRGPAQRWPRGRTPRRPNR